MTSELLAILFDFDHTLTRDNQLKTNDVPWTLFRITSTQSQFINNDYYKVTHLALSLTSLVSCLADTASTATIKQNRL